MKTTPLRWVFALAFAASVAADPPKRASTENSWIGVYSSPSEIGGYTGTVLFIDRSITGQLEHRTISYSDVVITDKDRIEQPESQGDIMLDGDKLYLSSASGFYYRRKPVISGHIERYTRVRINGRSVLLRDDALEAYRRHDSLYDYGILIKVADRTDAFADVNKVKHESIKVLYKNPKKEWNDPFVHGANKR
jgi:hypothetical protein